MNQRQSQAKPRPVFLTLPADKPVTVVMNTGEIVRIHLLSPGPGASYDPDTGLQYAVRRLPDE